jgi:60kDa lysophospholipase
LKKYGANLLATDFDGRTLLHVAASEGQLPVVEYLLSEGASVHMKDRNDNTPLMSAVLSDKHDVVCLQ